MSTVEHTQSTRQRDAGRTTELTQESVFDVLSASRRRYVLHQLFRHEEQTSLRDLSEQVAAWENDVPVDEVTYEQRMRVYTSLRQLHLPKLHSEGLVDYDENRGTIELTDDAAEVELYLEVVPHEEIRWSKYYAGLGALCAGALAVAALGIVPLASIPGFAWAGIITSLFWGSALVHCRHDANNRLGSGEEPPT